MSRYVVTLHYTVAPAVPGREDRQVLDGLMGTGCRFSLLGPDLLAVSVSVRSRSPGEAVEVLDDRVRAMWPMVGAGGSLTLATATANGDLVPVGVRRSTLRTRRVPDKWRDGGPRLGRLRSPSWDGWEDDGWGDAGPDDWGGSAGVREPRRPKTPPGHLSAAVDVPTT
jgi:hypothetical protein